MLTTILNITKLDKKGFNSLLMHKCENAVCEKNGHISLPIFYFSKTTRLCRYKIKDGFHSRI